MFYESLCQHGALAGRRYCNFKAGSYKLKRFNESLAKYGIKCTDSLDHGTGRDTEVTLELMR
jgi:hypothetical protein